MDGCERHIISLEPLLGDSLRRFLSSAPEGTYRILKNLSEASLLLTRDTSSPSSTPSPANPSASAASNGTSSETEPTSPPASPVTLTQLSRAFAGLTSLGRDTLSAIRISRSNPTTVTIAIDLCAKSSDTAAITEASLRRWLRSQSSRSKSSKPSSPNTSEPSQPTSDGMKLLITNSDGTVTSYRLCKERDISSVDETLRTLSGKR